MASLVLLAVCLLAGAALRRAGRLPGDAAKSITTFVLYLSLPAVTLRYVHAMPLGGSLASWAAPVAMAWLVFALGVGVFALVARRLRWGRETFGAIVLTAGLGNTSFVGFPLLEALYGQSAIATGVLTDQPGSFLVFSTLGALVASSCAPKARESESLLARVVMFPPFVALVVAVVTRPVAYPPALVAALDTLGASLAPLALFAVGCRIRLERGSFYGRRAALAAGLAYKLVIAPAVIATLYVGVFGLRGRVIQITIVEAAMAPMITAAVLAADTGLEPGLADLMVAIGIPLSLVSAPLWAWAVRWV